MSLQRTVSSNNIMNQYDTADIESIPSPTLSDFSSASFMPTEMGDDHVAPELIAVNGNDSDNTLRITLNSFMPIIERLPGLVLEDNTYHIKSPLSAADLLELQTYCKCIEQLTLTDASYDQYPLVAPNTFARLSRVEDPESPLLSSLKHLHLLDANLTLCYLIFCVTPSLESLKISGIPRSQSITISCFLEDLALSVVPGLASITLGPGLLSAPVLKASLEFAHLRHLHIEDAIASLDFDLLQGIANLRHLESFSIDARTAEYARRPDSESYAHSSPNEDDASSDQLATPFLQLVKLAVTSNVVLMGDLIQHLFPRAVKDITLTMVLTGPVQLPPIYDRCSTQSNVIVPLPVPPVAEGDQTSNSSDGELLPEPMPADGMAPELTQDHQVTSQGIMATLTRIVQELGLQSPPPPIGPKMRTRLPLVYAYHIAADRVAEAELGVAEAAAPPDQFDVSNISDSKIIRQLKAEAKLTETRLALAEIEVRRVELAARSRQSSVFDKCRLATECQLQLVALYSRQLQLAAECEQQLVAEHERHVNFTAEHEQHEQSSVASNIAAQIAYFASITKSLLEFGKPEVIVLGRVDLLDAVSFAEGAGSHTSSVQFPSATFETLLSNTDLVRLKIRNWALESVENSFLDMLKPSISLRALCLPLETHLNSGITLPTLRVITHRFPKLLELKTRIIPSVHQPFTFDLDENRICHGLDTLAVGGGCLLEEDKVAVVTYMWSLFPHLKSIVTRDSHDAEDWRYVHRLIEAFQKVRAMEHKLCQHA